MVATYVDVTVRNPADPERSRTDSFSSGVQDILDKFELRNQIAKLSKADASGSPIRKFTSPDINLSPAPACPGTGFLTRFVSTSSTLQMRCEGERHDC